MSRKNVKKNTKNTKKNHFFLIPCVLLAVSLASGAAFAIEAAKYEEASASYKALMTQDASETVDVEETVETFTASSTEVSVEDNSSDVAIDAVATDEETEDAVVEEQIECPEYAGTDLTTLAEINPDFVGVISIPALDVLYPVAQGSDNDYYLHNDFEGNSSVNGCIFLDAAANHDMTDDNTFMFGHNMKNGTMFGSLKQFIWNPDKFANADLSIYLYAEDCTYKYDIFCYRVISADDEIYLGSDYVGGYEAYVSAIMDGNQCDKEIGDALASQPRLLTLSTCYGTDGNSRFIVCAYLEGVAE